MKGRPPPRQPPTTEWPDAVVVEPGVRLFLSFGDVPHPDFVEVRVYGQETDAGGLPAAIMPLTVLECRLTEPRRDLQAAWLFTLSMERRPFTDCSPPLAQH